MALPGTRSAHVWHPNADEEAGVMCYTGVGFSAVNFLGRTEQKLGEPRAEPRLRA